MSFGKRLRVLRKKKNMTRKIWRISLILAKARAGCMKEMSLNHPLN